jgi:TPR repeat protein
MTRPYWFRGIACLGILTGFAILILSVGFPASAAQQNSNAPSGYSFCSNEGETCVFAGTQNVAFGANGSFYYKIGLSGHVTCDDATFGDPLSGVPKACYVTGDQHQALSPQPLADGYNFCSDEGKTCAFAGMRNVAFGANGRFYYGISVAGSIVCDGARFGDPIPGVVKACYISAPLEAPPPPPQPSATGDPFRTAASLFQNKQYAQALPFFKQAAAAGNSDAEVCLGWMYQYGSTLGQGVPQDYKEAVSWYQRAANARNAAAEFYLGVIYLVGANTAGVPVDYAHALSLLQKAAAGGEPAAETALGTMYQFGQGVPQDSARALAWYQKAATAGDAGGEWNLGVMYVNGLGVAKDPEMAALWQGKAKQSGLRLPSDPVQLAATLNYSDSATGAQGSSDADAHSVGVGGSCGADQSGQAANAGATSQPVDVRYTPPETRMLADEEFRALARGLHYSPPCAPLAKGGSATTTLLDGANRPLASISVQWLSSSGSSAAPTGNFRIALQNMSNCEISPEATLAIPGSAIGADAVSSLTWGKWLALHDPSGGESDSFAGSATLSSDYSSLILMPRNPELALSQCRTSGVQQQTETSPPPPPPTQPQTGTSQPQQMQAASYAGGTYHYTDSIIGSDVAGSYDISVSISGNQVTTVSTDTGSGPDAITSRATASFSAGDVSVSDPASYTDPGDVIDPAVWMVAVQCKTGSCVSATNDCVAGPCTSADPAQITAYQMFFTVEADADAFVRLINAQ